MLKIVTIPDPVLTTPVKPVRSIDARIKKLVRDMEDALRRQRDPEGVGLAAPQVGVSLSLFIVKQSSTAKTLVCINPSIVAVHEPPHRAVSGKGRMEGCLSIPRIWAPLARPRRVELRYTALDGAQHTKICTGLMSVVAQHEVDHLQGILFTQRCLEHNVPLYEEQGDKLEPMKAI